MAEPKKFKIKVLKTDRKRLVKGLLIALLFATALFFGGLAGTYVAVRRTVPDISALETYEPAVLTAIYGDDGKVLKEIGPEKRIVLTYDQIPEDLRNAIIATEDPKAVSCGKCLAAISRSTTHHTSSSAVIQCFPSSRARFTGTE